jgi:hypothetical protein
MSPSMRSHEARKIRPSLMTEALPASRVRQGDQVGLYSLERQTDELCTQLEAIRELLGEIAATLAALRGVSPKAAPLDMAPPRLEERAMVAAPRPNWFRRLVGRR